MMQKCDTEEIYLVKKSILKKVVCIVILGCLLLGTLCGWRYYEDQQRKKQDAYFTDKKITAYEMGIMVD